MLVGFVGSLFPFLVHIYTTDEIRSDESNGQGNVDVRESYLAQHRKPPVAPPAQLCNTNSMHTKIRPSPISFKKLKIFFYCKQANTYSIIQLQLKRTLGGKQVLYLPALNAKSTQQHGHEVNEFDFSLVAWSHAQYAAGGTHVQC